MPMWLAIPAFLMGILITVLGVKRIMVGQGWGLALVGVAIMFSAAANQVNKARKGEKEEG